MKSTGLAGSLDGGRRRWQVLYGKREASGGNLPLKFTSSSDENRLPLLEESLLFHL